MATTVSDRPNPEAAPDNESPPLRLSYGPRPSPQPLRSGKTGTVTVVVKSAGPGTFSDGCWIPLGLSS
jgi:hypothetical protein